MLGTITACDCHRNFLEAKKTSCRGPSWCSPDTLCDAQLKVTRFCSCVLNLRILHQQFELHPQKPSHRPLQTSCPLGGGPSLAPIAP
eukprot:s1389_g26.t1